MIDPELSVRLQILRVLGSYRLPANPTAHDALWAVTALGGHIRSNGEPGWLVLHRGMAKLLTYEDGWLARGKMHGLPISRQTGTARSHLAELTPLRRFGACRPI